MKAYLAGAIEYAPDSGKTWRNDLSYFLKFELGHDVYNPLIEEGNILTSGESKKFRSLKNTNPETFKNIVRKLMRNDIKSLDTEIDYLICYWDSFATKGGGTYGELTFAFYKNISVYMVTEQPLKDISGWILGCTTEIFTSFAELKNFLRSKYKNL